MGIEAKLYAGSRGLSPEVERELLAALDDVRRMIVLRDEIYEAIFRIAERLRYLDALYDWHEKIARYDYLRLGTSLN